MKTTSLISSCFRRAGSCHPARNLRLLCGRTIATLALAGSPGVMNAQVDDFNDGNDAGWTHYDPIATALGGTFAQFTFPSGRYRIQALVPPVPNAGTARAASVQDSHVYSRFYVAVDLVDWGATLDQAIGIVARLQQIGLMTTDGYAFTAQPADNAVAISRIVNEEPFDVPGTVGALVLNPNRDYRFVFSGHASGLVGQVFELPDLVNPVVTVSGGDATYTTGVSGLIVADLSSAGNGAGDATFDNYLALDAPPPALSISVDSANLATLIWPLPATGFELEFSPVLPAAAWTVVQPAEITNDGVNYSHQVNASAGARFFRLRRTFN